MIKKTIFVILIIISLTTYILTAPTTEKIKYWKGSNNIRHITHYLKWTPIKHGKKIIFDINSKKDTAAILNYRFGRLNGVQKEFYQSSNKLFRVDTIKGNTKTTVEYHKNGYLKSYYITINGKLHNIYELRDSLNNKLNIGDFSNGNGKVYVYFDDGKIKYYGNYRNGKPSGKWISISNTGYKKTIKNPENFSFYP